jgi:NAD(P)-dependent dehydrogenase (short-subunit alcohol dehydrogenase family)
MMLKLCISVEEPQVTAIGLRPGRVDTDMQAQIREKGKDVMHPDDHQSFVQAKEKGLLVKPEDCARSIVALAVAARDGEWRGAEVSWQDHRVQSLAARVFNDA